jgi:hypothetical protein
LEVFFPDGADLGFEAQSLDYTSIALAGLLDGLPCPQLERFPPQMNRVGDL